MPILDPLTRHVADVVVEDRVIVEIKAVQALDDAHITQGLNDLRTTNLETRLLINFGKANIEVRRLNMGPGKRAGVFELDVKDVP